MERDRKREWNKGMQRKGREERKVRELYELASVPYLPAGTPWYLPGRVLPSWYGTYIRLL